MTLYELIKRVSDIITPETGAFYNYVLYTSDDNGGFLRTRFCWWDKPVKDHELGDGCKTVLVTAKTPITEAGLADKSDVDSFDGTAYTKVKIQFTYSKCECTADDAEWDTELGYCHVYLFDLEKNNFVKTYIKCPYC